MGGTRGPWPGLVGRRGPPAPGQGRGPCWLPGAGGPSKAWPRSVPGTASPRPGPTERQTAWMYNQRPRRHVLFPGVTLRPDVYGEKGLDISYNVSDNRTWTGLTQALHHFLAGRVQNALQCLHSFLVSGTPWGAGGRGGRSSGRAAGVPVPQATHPRPRRPTSTARPRGTSSRRASWPRTTPSSPASSQQTCCKTARAGRTPPSALRKESRVSSSR